jgi:hypothetical protein
VQGVDGGEHLARVAAEPIEIVDDEEIRPPAKEGVEGTAETFPGAHVGAARLILIPTDDGPALADGELLELGALALEARFLGSVQRRDPTDEDGTIHPSMERYRLDTSQALGDPGRTFRKKKWAPHGWTTAGAMAKARKGPQHEKS